MNTDVELLRAELIECNLLTRIIHLAIVLLIISWLVHALKYVAKQIRQVKPIINLYNLKIAGIIYLVLLQYHKLDFALLSLLIRAY